MTDGNTEEFLVDFRWVQEETSPQSDIINGHLDKGEGPLTRWEGGCLGRTGQESLRNTGDEEFFCKSKKISTLASCGAENLQVSMATAAIRERWELCSCKYCAYMGLQNNV